MMITVIIFEEVLAVRGVSELRVVRLETQSVLMTGSFASHSQVAQSFSVTK